MERHASKTKAKQNQLNPVLKEHTPARCHQSNHSATSDPPDYADQVNR